jgi:hypothetical protein
LTAPVLVDYCNSTLIFIDLSNSMPIQLGRKTIDIQELAITIAAKGLNPMSLNLDILKQTGVIPGDWELNRQPVQNPRVVQLSFKSGVNLVAQPGSVTFSQAFGHANQTVQIPDVAMSYLDKFPNIDYQGVSISPKSLIGFGEEGNLARQFITENLLAPGPWRELGTAPMQANLNLVYRLEHCPMTLSINEARVQRPEKSPIAALLFSGSFNYQTNQGAIPERVSQIKAQINNWQRDMKTFREIVNQRFLGQAESEVESVFPGGVINPDIVGPGLT